MTLTAFTSESVGVKEGIKNIEVNYSPNIFTISIGREGVYIDHYNSLLLFSLFMQGGGVLWGIVPNSLYPLFFFWTASLNVLFSAVVVWLGGRQNNLR